MRARYLRSAPGTEWWWKSERWKPRVLDFLAGDRYRLLVLVQHPICSCGGHGATGVRRYPETRRRMRLVPKCNAPDHSLATFLTILKPPYELCEQVDRCRGISSRFSLLFPASSRHLGPFCRNRIMLLDRIPVTENLPCSSLVVRTQFPELPLAFVPIEGSVLFLIVKNSPKLETWVGNGQWNIVSTGQDFRLVESRMDIHIEHRPYGIPSRESIILQLLQFFDCPFDHCSWITADTYRDQPHGLVSMEPIEYLEIFRFGRHSFRGHHDSPCQRASCMSPRNAPRATHDSAETSLLSKSMKKSSPIGTPPRRPCRYAFSISSRERSLNSVRGVNWEIPS